MFWEGYSRQSHANRFVMVAGGRVWRWESTTNTWNSVPQPVREKGDEHDDSGDVIGVFPVGNKDALDHAPPTSFFPCEAQSRLSVGYSRHRQRRVALAAER